MFQQSFIAWISFDRLFDFAIAHESSEKKQRLAYELYDLVAKATIDPCRVLLYIEPIDDLLVIREPVEPVVSCQKYHVHYEIRGEHYLPIDQMSGRGA